MSPAASAPARVRGSFSKLVAAAALVAATVGGGWVLPTSAGAEATFNSRMVQLINEARAANGLSPLGTSPVLAGLAEGSPYSGCGFHVAGRAVDMGQRSYFSHTIKDCGTQNVFDMVDAAQFTISAAGENIGWLSGVSNVTNAAASLHDGFMNSPGHRANVLNGNFNAVGVGSWLAAPGQGWSGGGGNHQGVLVTAVVFAKVPGGVPSVSPPQAPTSVSANQTNGGAAVIWSAPAGPSGAPIDSYAVLVFDVNGYTGIYATACGTCRSVAVTGLANGSYFAVGVLAHNSAGWGDAAYSDWFAPGTPSAPRSLSVTPASTSLRASWSPPTTANGSAVQGYAAVGFDAGGEFRSYAMACATCRSATVAGLPAGQPYVVAVLPYNANGWGSYAASGWVSPTA